MSAAGRLNIDVTATTGKFDAAMAGVRRQMSGVGRAGAAAGALSGVAMPGFGAVGALGGLSGPLIGVTAGLAALTAAMRDRDKDAAKANDAIDLALGRNIDFGQAQRLFDVGNQIGTGGDGMMKLLETASTGSGLEAIRAVDRQMADYLEAQFKAGEFNRAMFGLQQASLGPNAQAIAGGLGGSGTDFLRMARVNLGSAAGLDADDAEMAMRNQNFEAMNPSSFTRFFSWISELFGGDPFNSDLSQEQLQVLRQIAATNGPGL
jgi:hypothetical protein